MAGERMPALADRVNVVDGIRRHQPWRAAPAEWLKLEVLLSQAQPPCR
tara:strand:- start:769 stop:912 length:144 start_codon:yes stop_codon:yes gene_type:complete